MSTSYKVTVRLSPDSRAKPGPKAPIREFSDTIRETRVGALTLVLLREAHKRTHYRNEDVKEALLWAKVWLNPEQSRARGGLPVAQPPFTKTINTITIEVTPYEQ